MQRIERIGKVVLRFVLAKEVYFTIAMWWGSLTILSSIVATCIGFSEDSEYSFITSMETIIAIAGLILMAVL